MSADSFQPLHLLAINLTRRCNLACAHCYLDADALRSGARDELTTAEVRSVIEEVARRSAETMVVLTGGEPLLRRDLEQIVACGAERGLAMAVGTNATLLSARRARSLKQAGLLGLGISVDSLDPGHHDRFRGVPGAWRRSMAGIDAARRAGLSFQIHFSVSEGNAHELPAMIGFARAAGSRALNVFFLVCTGRGESVTDLSPLRYEQVLKELIEAQERCPEIIIRPRCAPHFKRVAFQRNPDSALNRISGREGDGCIAGIHYCRITPEGGVTVCPYIEGEQGNVRSRAFLEIWDRGADFQRLRSPALRGKCGVCEFRALCGGCRARPLAQGGDIMDADSMCAYAPRGGTLIAPLGARALHDLNWSPEAEKCLQRVPAFLRGLVRKRAEAYVAGLGQDTVLPDHLSQLAARRFGGGGPTPPERFPARSSAPHLEEREPLEPEARR